MPVQPARLAMTLAAIAILAAGCSVGSSRTFAFTLTYAVGPSAGASPTDQDVQAVAISIGARLSQTGLADYRVRTPGSGMITVEAAPASAIETARAMATTPGRLSLVPLGQATAKPKDALDVGTHPPLLGERDVTHSTIGKDPAGGPAVTLQLTQPAAQAFFTWTSTHVGETLAVVMDGVIVAASAVTGPIDGGLVTVGGFDAAGAGAFAALVNGGPLAFPVTEVQAPGASPSP